MGQIYDTHEMAYPYTPDTPITFSISTPDTTLKEVYFNNRILFTTTERNFDVDVYPSLHSLNEIYAVDTLQRKTETIYFMVYNLHFLIFVSSTDMRDLYIQVQQSHIDKTLAAVNSNSLMGHTLSQSNVALTRIFGEHQQVSRINDTKEEYRLKLKNTLNAFYFAGTVKGFKTLMQGFSSGDTDFITYMDLEELRASSNIHLHRSAPMEVGWFPGFITMSGHRQFLDAGNMVVASGDSSQFVYVDGELSGGSLVVKKSDVEPVGTTVEQTEQPTQIYTDTDGSLTGLVGGKYVILEYPVLELKSVDSDGSIRPQGAELLSDESSILVLRTDATVAQIGAVTVVYDAHIRPIVLGLVKTNATDVATIEEPVPTRGSIYREAATEESDFELFLTDSNLSDEEEQQLLELLREINVTTGMGHVWIKKVEYTFGSWVSIPGMGVMGSEVGYNQTYEYHKLGYRFLGLV